MLFKKKCFNMERSKGILCAKIYRKSIVNENSLNSAGSLVDYQVRPSNYLLQLLHFDKNDKDICKRFRIKVILFLVHQSQRLQDRQWSAVVCRQSTLSNDISSEATGPVRPKFYLWHAWAGVLKVCVCVCVFYENWLFNLVAMAT